MSIDGHEQRVRMCACEWVLASGVYRLLSRSAVCIGHSFNGLQRLLGKFCRATRLCLATVKAQSRRVAYSQNRSLLLSVAFSTAALPVPFPSLSNVAAPRHEPCTIRFIPATILLLRFLSDVRFLLIVHFVAVSGLRGSTSRRHFFPCPIIRFARHQRLARKCL